MESHADLDTEADALFRRFGSEMESQISSSANNDENASSDLAIAVVERRRTDDLEARERAEWRNYFEPWEPSEYGHLHSLPPYLRSLLGLIFYVIVIPR